MSQFIPWVRADIFNVEASGTLYHRVYLKVYITHSLTPFHDFNSFPGVKVESLKFHGISTDTQTGEWDGVDLGPQLRMKPKEEGHISLTLRRRNLAERVQATTPSVTNGFMHRRRHSNEVFELSVLFPSSFLESSVTIVCCWLPSRFRS
jgi:hypothetical protein